MFIKINSQHISYNSNKYIKKFLLLNNFYNNSSQLRILPSTTYHNNIRVILNSHELINLIKKELGLNMQKNAIID